MANKALVETDLRALLAAADGSYVAAYDKLVAKVEAEQISVSKRSTKADRQSKWSKALAKMDRGILAKINKTLSGYMGLVRAQTFGQGEELRQISDEEAVGFMQEYLARRDIEDFLKVRHEFTKTAIFNHLTEQFAEAGEEFPEHVSGSVLVPALGMKFCREGTGRKDPVLDEDALAEALGEDVWNQVLDVELVETRTLNIEKLMKLASTQDNPNDILEKVRGALKEGGWKPPRFVPRPMTPDDYES